MTQAGQLDAVRSAPFAVVCGVGQRSSQACVRLAKVFGFASPINVQGGMAAWEAGGYRMERSAALQLRYVQGAAE